MRIGQRIVGRQLRDGLACDEVVVVAEKRMFVGRADHGVESEPPAIGIGHQGDGVAKRLAKIPQGRLAVGLARAAAPGVAVEIVQHGSPPVALLRRGNRACETHAKGRIVRCGELRDAAGAHALAKPRDRIIVRGQRPEAPGQARKEQEEDERERQGEQQAARGKFGCDANLEARATIGRDEERGTAQERVAQIERQSHERLPVEARCEQQKEGRADHDVAVTSAARLEELDRAHDDEEHGARGKSVQGMEGRDHASHEHEREDELRGFGERGEFVSRYAQLPRRAGDEHRRRP